MPTKFVTADSVAQQAGNYEIYIIYAVYLCYSPHNHRSDRLPQREEAARQKQQTR